MTFPTWGREVSEISYLAPTLITSSLYQYRVKETEGGGVGEERRRAGGEERKGGGERHREAE